MEHLSVAATEPTRGWRTDFSKGYPGGRGGGVGRGSQLTEKSANNTRSLFYHLKGSKKARQMCLGRRVS